MSWQRMVLLALSGYIPGALLWALGWTWYYSRPGREYGGSNSDYLGTTVATMLLWPVVLPFVSLYFVIDFIHSLAISRMVELGRKTYRNALDRRDNNLLAKLRENPLLLEKYGTKIDHLEDHPDDQLWWISFRAAGERMYLLRVKDRTTGQLYIIRVPRSQITEYNDRSRQHDPSAAKAVAWTFGVARSNQFNPLKVT